MRRRQLTMITNSLVISLLLLCATSKSFSQKIRSVEKDAFDESITVCTSPVLLDKALFHDYNISFLKIIADDKVTYEVKLYLMGSSIRSILSGYFFKIKLENGVILELESKYDKSPHFYSGGYHTIEAKYVIQESQLEEIRNSKIEVCRVEMIDGYIQIEAKKNSKKKTDNTIDLIIDYEF